MTHPRSGDGEYYGNDGMSLRDWFAGQFQVPAEMDKSIGQADDADLLERFGTPEEREQGFRMVFGTTSPQYRHHFANVEVIGQAMPTENAILRQKLEARMRSALRYIEADAMLAARQPPPPPGTKGGTP